MHPALMADQGLSTFRNTLRVALQLDLFVLQIFGLSYGVFSASSALRLSRQSRLRQRNQ